MEEYYPDELPLIMQEYAELSKTVDTDVVEVSAEDF